MPSIISVSGSLMNNLSAYAEDFISPILRKGDTNEPL